MRAFRKDAHERLEPQTTDMEFVSETVVKATLLGQRIAGVPTTLSPDGRTRPPHLRRWRDGWRHLRFLLLYSPRWLFLYPGIALMAVGLLAMLWILPGPRRVGAVALFWALGDWGARSFGELDPRDSLRLVPAVLGLALGVQVVLSSFFLSVLGMRRRRGAAGGAPP